MCKNLFPKQLVGGNQDEVKTSKISALYASIYHWAKWLQAQQLLWLRVTDFWLPCGGCLAAELYFLGSAGKGLDPAA